MKRDNELIRELLFSWEQDEDWLFLTEGDSSGSTEEERRRRYHMLLLRDKGFVVEVGSVTFRLTSEGHDFLDAIRSDTIWKKTKLGAAEVGGMTLEMMKDLAVAYLKQEAAEKLGINL